MSEPGIRDLYYTQSELAAELGVSKRTVQDWDYKNIGPPRLKRGRKEPWYRKAAVQQWLLERETHS